MKRWMVALAGGLVVLCAPFPSHEAPTAAPANLDVQTHESQESMTPSAALAHLKEGNGRFVANAMKPRNWSANVAATAGGQFPFAAVLSCMDSRAPAEIVFDQGLGDVFSVRVAGNVVNADELGSLEYAIHAGTKLIVVMGHTGCGAIKGALDDTKLGNLTGLLTKVRPAVTAAHCSSSKDDACVAKVAEMNVRESLREILKQSPYIKEHVDQGKAKLVGALYDIATGKATFLEN